MRPHAALFAILAWSAVARADPAGHIGSFDQPYSARLSIGGGVSGYVEDNGLAPGGTWDVRLTFPAIKSWLRAEVAYVGSVHSTNGLSSATNFTHSFESDGRLYFDRRFGDFLVEPFVFGGFAYSFLLTSAPMTAGSGDVLIPFGLGLTMIREGFLVEGRLTYRHAFNDHLIARTDGTHASMTSWSATMALGYAF